MSSQSKKSQLPFIVLCVLISLAGITWFILSLSKRNDAIKEALSVLPSTPKQVRIVFAGDLMQHKPQVTAARNEAGEYDYTESFAGIKTIFEEADLAILNLETTLNPKPYYTGYPLFRSPPEVANILSEIGIDVAVLANNHICDNGETGIRYTTSRLDSLGIRHTGAFIDNATYHKNNPLLLDVNGLQIALFNYTYDTNGVPIPKEAIVNQIDTTALSNDLAKIDRTQTDCVIVFFHWGDEYARQPNRTQKELASFCHSRGVEMVIGSHPHVIQPFDLHYDTDSLIRNVTVYSLGNLVSNQRDRYKNGGLIVTLDLIKKDNEPIEIVPYYTPVWVMLPKYRILPPTIADTLDMPGNQQNMYKQFLEDTRKHLSFNELFQEK